MAVWGKLGCSDGYFGSNWNVLSLPYEIVNLLNPSYIPIQRLEVLWNVFILGKV